MISKKNSVKIKRQNYIIMKKYILIQVNRLIKHKKCLFLLKLGINRQILQQITFEILDICRYDFYIHLI